MQIDQRNRSFSFTDGSVDEVKQDHEEVKPLKGLYVIESGEPGEFCKFFTDSIPGKEIWTNEPTHAKFMESNMIHVYMSLYGLSNVNLISVDDIRKVWKPVTLLKSKDLHKANPIAI